MYFPSSKNIFENCDDSLTEINADVELIKLGNVTSYILTPCESECDFCTNRGLSPEYRYLAHN